MKKFYGIFIMLVLVQLSFAQKITVPVLSSPENEYEYAMPDVILDWDAVSGIGEITYQVQMATDEAFTELIVDQDEISLTAYYNEFLLFGQQYFWRVKATDDIGTSDWSSAYHFSIFTTIDPDRPKNGDDEVDMRPTFKWKDEVDDNAITGLDGFQVEIDTAETFDSPINRLYNIEGIVFDFSPDYLLFGKVYYWHIRPIHTVDNGEWSETWDFETLIGIELKKPNDNSTEEEFDVELKWTDLENNDDDIFEYTVELSLDSDFSNPTSRITNESSLVPDFLKFGTEYFWRAKAAHTHDVSPWAEYRTFTTVSEVILETPEDEEIVQITRPKLEWDKLADVDGYEVRFSANADMTDAEYFILPGATNDNMTLDELAIDSDYFWSVRAYKTTDTSAWADNFSFHIPWNIGLNEMQNISQLSIFPNPATTTVSIQFLAKENMELKVSISDILGKTITEKTMEISSGNFKTSFNVSEFNNGVYFIELQQGDRKNVLKFVVK
ncbi:MAG: T9SS type A sorting domain-containing protein [Bacteroidales bacterium]|nr:T9SS type A sorting domain-containing protein [Bacteroidales bacterium]